MKNTAIIFTSDHGFYLGEHGYIGKSLVTDRYQQAIPLYPEVARIPLLIYRPGEEKTRIRNYVQPPDLMPTVLDLLGVPVPKSVQARSIVSKSGKNRDAVICSPTISHPGLELPHPTTRSSIYRGDWLLVYGAQVHAVRDRETTRMVDSVLRRVRVLEKGRIRPALYHLPSDPGCRRNVIKKHTGIARDLHQRYVAFLEEAKVPEHHLRFFRDI
jgi:arylsulfatase A-like enzyme